MTPKLYEFTVSGATNSLFSDVWKLSREIAEEQRDYEVDCGGETWPAWELLLVQLDTQAGIDTYHFEVRIK